jgi:ribosomal protein L3 glutamine methyltransferase
MKTPKYRPKKSTDSAKNIVSDLHTVGDFIRYGVSRFGESDLFFGHGTDNAFDEAVFIVLESLSLPVDTLEPYWHSRLTRGEKTRIARVILDRVSTRKPAPYLLNRSYLLGYPFYVDERVLVPRSFIAEILCRDGGFAPLPDATKVHSVLDLCTGSGCLGIIAAHLFPNAVVDCADISEGALEVAKQNIREYGLEHRVFTHQGDLFDAVKDNKYDLILTNPPYVDKEGMDALPDEFRNEPALALAAGDDGLDIVHRILAEAKFHLNDGAGILCELGRCGPALKDAYPDKAFTWVDTVNSSGEVFWIKKENL